MILRVVSAASAMVFAIACVACGREEPAPAVVADVAPAVAHGDHSPHHGGVVMMKGDLHYEVVLDPNGRYRVYFTDATRADLPGSTAAAVSIRVDRKGEPPESVPMQIDDSGESWIGEGTRVADPASTIARLSYEIRGEDPYWIDLPFVPVPAASDPHKRP